MIGAKKHDKERRRADRRIAKAARKEAKKAGKPTPDEPRPAA
jgi:hypothetical protein